MELVNDQAGYHRSDNTARAVEHHDLPGHRAFDPERAHIGVCPGRGAKRNPHQAKTCQTHKHNALIFQNIAQAREKTDLCDLAFIHLFAFNQNKN